MHSVKLSNGLRLTVAVFGVVTVSLLSGCRSGSGSERTVRVTETAPTVTPRATEGMIVSDTSEKAPKSTLRTTQKRKRGILAGARLPGQKGDSDSRLTLSDQTPPAPSQTEAGRIARAQALLQSAETSNRSDQESVGGLVSASLNDLHDSMSVTPRSDPALPERATKTPDATPKTPENVTALAVSKRETNSPRAINAALKDSLEDLPQLSELQMVPSGLSTKRLGEKKRPSSATAAASRGRKALTREDAVQTAATKPTATDQILPVSHDEQAIEPMEPAVQTIAPAIAVSEPAESELFDQLVSRLQQPVAGESPTERDRRMIVARHLMVLAGNPVAATESMQGMSDTDQKYLKHQLLGLWTMIDPQGHPSSGRRITAALPQFREATRYLSEATDSLQLNNIEFCTEIEAYGQIKPFDGNRFEAGQQVILYCEVENFLAEESNGTMQTRLRGTYDLYDADGAKVVSQLLPVDEQTSRNHLRDYFLAYQMNLPPQLVSGSYRMQLTIEDVVGKKYGQAEIPFEIK